MDTKIPTRLTATQRLAIDKFVAFFLKENTSCMTRNVRIDKESLNFVLQKDAQTMFATAQVSVLKDEENKFSISPSTSATVVWNLDGITVSASIPQSPVWVLNALNMPMLNLVTTVTLPGNR